MPASENKQLQKPLKGLVRIDRLGGDLPSDERALPQPRTQLLSPPLGGALASPGRRGRVVGRDFVLSWVRLGPDPRDAGLRQCWHLI